MFIKRLILIIFITLPAIGLADNPCGGPSAMLNLIDRPSDAYSPCVVPAKKIIIESGYEYDHLALGAGSLNTIPNTEVRLGLPGSNEVFALLPTYNKQTYAPRSGFSSINVGFKHQFVSTPKWLFTTETGITPPGGSYGFGSKEYGGIINGIASYTINDKWSVTFMFGYSNTSLPSYFGDLRYSSFNPDLLVSYALNEKALVFLEFYGQTHTGPGLGSGTNADLAIIYLLKQNITVDFEVGQRVNGYLYGLENYINTGLSIMF